MDMIHTIATVLVVVGAINWLSVAMGQNWVHSLTSMVSSSPVVEQIVYYAVGISGVLVAYYMFLAR